MNLPGGMITPEFSVPSSTLMATASHMANDSLMMGGVEREAHCM